MNWLKRRWAALEARWILTENSYHFFGSAVVTGIVMSLLLVAIVAMAT